ncbi:hypothetical protein ACHAWF_009956, partial [Thalassiosira exigua]
RRAQERNGLRRKSAPPAPPRLSALGSAPRDEEPLLDERRRRHRGHRLRLRGSDLQQAQIGVPLERPPTAKQKELALAGPISSLGYLRAELPLRRFVGARNGLAPVEASADASHSIGSDASFEPVRSGRKSDGDTTDTPISRPSPPNRL